MSVSALIGIACLLSPTLGLLGEDREERVVLTLIFLIFLVPVGILILSSLT